MQKQDQIIGNCLIKQRTIKNSNLNVANNNNNNNSNKNMPQQQTNLIRNTEMSTTNKTKLAKNANSKEKVDDLSSMNLPVYGNLSSSIKKAYTIAGTVPNFFMKFSKNDYSYKESMDKSMYATNGTPRKRSIPTEALNMSTSSIQHVDTLPMKKSTLSSFNIILGDFLVLIVALLVFSADLVNLINDSDFINDNIDDQDIIKNDYALFQFLLNFYNYNMAALFVILLVTVHLSYKR